MSKSINKVIILGNATREPELRYTPSGTAVCSFSIATNREWKDASGQKKDEVTFHKIVAWSKLAEIISQYVKKGSKVYTEGRIANRSWNDQQGNPRNVTEIIANDIILLDSKRVGQVIAVPAVDSTQLLPPEPDPVKNVTVDVEKDTKEDVPPSGTLS